MEDWELFAILLGKGCKNKNVETLSREILENFNGLLGFLKVPFPSILKFSGIGKAKVATLLAAKELVNRIKLQNICAFEKDPKLNSIADFLFFKTISETRENFFLILFDESGNLIQLELVARGGLNEVGVYPREIAKIALDYGAKSAIISHNHPNSTAFPSNADIDLFGKLKMILAPLEINLTDQWTIGSEGVYSHIEKKFLRNKR